MHDVTQSSLARGLDQVPVALRERAQACLDTIISQLPADSDPRLLECLPTVLAVSDFVGRAFVAQPGLLNELITSGDLLRVYAPTELAGRLTGALVGVADETELKRRLRLFRRRETVRIALRDLAGFADLHEVMATMSALADASIAHAVDRLFVWFKEKHGTPIGETSGTPATFIVLGLGKLGGAELNFSSDVDLIFIYTEEGDTQGARVQSNHEFFLRLGQALINALAEATDDGFVFRVDMRLRPNGASGPLVLGVDAFEQYYQTHGRDWERYAFIKARVVGGDVAQGEALLAQLKPFVFRKYLDYGAFEAIRSMKTMIEREMARKGMHEHVKLGPGGIREIEFIGQALQLLRAGREPPLQCRPILEAFARLAERGYLPAPARDELSAAYVFLRNVEHRLQMIADQQTHVLPGEPHGRARIAFSMGFADWPAFEAALANQRNRVRHHFDHTFVIPGAEPAGGESMELAVWSGTGGAEAGASALTALGYRDATAAANVLAGFRASTAFRALSNEGRARIDRLMPPVIKAASSSAEPTTTLARLVNLLEAIGRRTTYFAMLAENRSALIQLVKLVAASAWIAQWIAKHPIVLDELLDPRSLYEPLTPAALAAELRARMSALAEDDLELQMEVLREFRHSHVLRVAAADIGPGLPPERVGAQLACIVETVLHESLQLAWRLLSARHGRPRCPGKNEPAGFAVIGYGKLGSLELGYASDLDMIFLYEGCDDVLSSNTAASDRTSGVTDGARALSNEEFFARLGQRVIQLLTTRTPSGVLYEVDMRLRPSGQSGTLVTSLAAFRDYQKNKAWTWEHQALVRARPVAGSTTLRDSFEQVRREILCRPRDDAALRREVVDMRGRITEAKLSVTGPFDLKHSRGGIVDIEFMVQYWVLRWAHAHPVLTRHTDNINILEALKAEGLLTAERATLLADAYRRYLSMEHRLKLAEGGSKTDPAPFGDLPARVQHIWDETFNG
jgi:[glutamine synthetase] adenylyltransferase / [glutamine synthetase]-adenylyl-L-tyrosine phosphorylase